MSETNEQYWDAQLAVLNGAPVAAGVVHEVAALATQAQSEAERSRRYRRAMWDAVTLIDSANTMSADQFFDQWNAIRESLVKLVNTADMPDLAP